MDIRTTLHDGNKKDVAGVLHKWTKPILNTMGVNGEVVIIGGPGGNIYTQDGITVARNLAPEDPFERMIINAVIDAAYQTVKDVGDGTTTTTALVKSLFCLICQYEIEGVESKLNLRERADEFSGLVEDAVKYIKDLALPIIDENGNINEDQLRHVATISCHNDEKLGGVIAELIAKVGADGDVAVKDSHTGKTYTEYFDGYVARSGLINANFINKPMLKASQLENCHVLIADQVIDDSDDMAAILEAYRVQVKQDYAGTSLVLICDDLQGGALNTAIANLAWMAGRGVNMTVIKAPMSGQRRAELLEDYAAITGAYVFRKIGGIPIGNINKNRELKPFGFVDSVTAYGDKTIFRMSNKEAVDKQVELIRELSKDAKEEKDLEFYNERISRLTSGIGVIYVGGETKAENTRTNALVDDAVKASIQALKHGVVPGGGKALAMAGKASGNQELYEALMYPMRIMHGDEVTLPKKEWSVIDGRTNEVVSAWDAGILDPASVPITALTKAFSVVKQLMLSDTFLILKDVSNGADQSEA